MNTEFDFPPNYGWVTNKQDGYSPLELPQELHDQLSQALLLTSKEFNHLLRSCKDHWYVTVLIGKRSVHLEIYEAHVVNNKLHPRGYDRLPENVSVFSCSRFSAPELIPQDDSRFSLIAKSYASLTARRQLRKNEIETYAAYGKPKVITQSDDFDPKEFLKQITELDQNHPQITLES